MQLLVAPQHEMIFCDALGVRRNGAHLGSEYNYKSREEEKGESVRVERGSYYNVWRMVRGKELRLGRI